MIKQLWHLIYETVSLVVSAIFPPSLRPAFPFLSCGKSKILSCLGSTAVAPNEEKEMKDWLTMLRQYVPPILKKREGLIISDKRAAIKELVDIIGVSNAISPMVRGLAYQLRQMIPIVGFDAVSDKPLSQYEKERVLVVLSKFTEKDIRRKITGTFRSAEFWHNTTRALYLAYAKYYSAEDAKDISNFYQSAAGKKYRKCQSLIRNDIMDELLKRYGTPSIQVMRSEIEKEIKTLIELMR